MIDTVSIHGMELQRRRWQKPSETMIGIEVVGEFYLSDDDPDTYNSVRVINSSGKLQSLPLNDLTTKSKDKILSHVAREVDRIARGQHHEQ